MHELRRTNDLAYLSFALAALRAEGIEPVVLDENQSAIEGSIGAIPRRLMVAAGESERALALLAVLDEACGDA